MVKKCTRLSQCSEVDSSFTKIADEIRHLFDGQTLPGTLTRGDYFRYRLDNLIASDPSSIFKILGVITLVIMVVQAICWNALVTAHGMDVFGAAYFSDCFYFSTLMMMKGGFDDALQGDTIFIHLMRILYVFMVLSGLVLFAILVGFITDSVGSFMTSLAEGKSKVTYQGLTMILGWNEATIRVVLQICVLRMHHYEKNRGRWFRKKMPPTTPLATSPIVIMSNQFTKAEMDEKLRTALQDARISQRHSAVGEHILCRIGDPTNLDDLTRIGVTRATSILITMAQADSEEEQVSMGKVQNGATIRTLLALRSALLANAFLRANSTGHLDPALRIVVQLSHPSESVDCVCFPSPEGTQICFTVEISKFLNTLMFSCVTQPGIAKVIAELLDNNGAAIRNQLVDHIYDDCHERLAKASGVPFKAPLIGLSMREAQEMLHSCVIIGMVPSKLCATSAVKESVEVHAIPSEGVAIDTDTILKEGDILIFVSEKAYPDFGVNGSSAKVSTRVTASAKISMDISKVQRNVMLLGFRQSWQDDSTRLAERLKSVLEDLASGSTFFLVNLIPPDEFAKLLDASQLGLVQCDVEVKPDKSLRAYRRNGVIVYHMHGDPATIRTLDKLIQRVDFDAAIVLGTHLGTKLPPLSRDTRVLVTMLHLRTLTDKYKKPVIHTVSENEFDYTVNIAPIAVTQSRKLALDFVNTQAITARILVMCLANPRINNALSDLFEEKKGTPDFRLLRAKLLLPLRTPVTFQEVLGRINQQNTLSKGRRVLCCLGYMTHHDEDMNICAQRIVFTPPKDFTWKYNEDDDLLCIVRDLADFTAVDDWKSESRISVVGVNAQLREEVVANQAHRKLEVDSDQNDGSLGGSLVGAVGATLGVTAPAAGAAAGAADGAAGGSSGEAAVAADGSVPGVPNSFAKKGKARSKPKGGT